MMNDLTLKRKIVLFFRKPYMKKATKISLQVLKSMFFVAVMFILYLPIMIIAIQSVNASESFYEFSYFSFKWYAELFTQFSFNINDAGVLGAVIERTLLIAFLSTIISTIVGTLFAIGIHSLSGKMKKTMVFMNQVPILNADIVTGISLMLIFKLFIDFIPNLFGLPTLLLAHIFFSLPYVVLSVLPKLAELDENLYEAALDLGARPAKAITHVIIPAISSGIFTGMLIAFTMSIDDFVISYFTTGNGFDNVSIWVYASIGRRMSPSIYAYNTLLSTIVISGMILYNVVRVIRNKVSQNRLFKKNKIKGVLN